MNVFVSSKSKKIYTLLVQGLSLILTNKYGFCLENSKEISFGKESCYMTNTIIM